MIAIGTEDGKAISSEDELFIFEYLQEIYNKILSFNLPIELLYEDDSVIEMNNVYGLPISLLKDMESYINFNKTYHSKVKPSLKTKGKI